jgi:3-oxoacyl-[acyl-carrier-protein] synthase-3
MQFIQPNLRIAAVAAALPGQRLELQSLASTATEAEIARIIRTTGIGAVRVAAADVRASDLCVAAARALFAAVEVDRSAIDAVVFVSQTPDRIMPATSATLQSRLELSPAVATFDVNGGCAGYIYGLLQAALLVSAGCRRVLLCSGDTVTRLIHPEDRALRMLFGDAGSATLLESGHSTAMFAVHTDGAGAETLLVPRSDEQALAQRIGARPGLLHMNGGEVMNFALRVVPEVIAEVCQLRGWKESDIGLIGLHQANEFLLRYVRRKLAVSEDAVPGAVDDAGNTGPASIPLLLTRVGSRFSAERRQRSLLCGFGVGLSWGAAALDLGTTQFVTPVLV